MTSICFYFQVHQPKRLHRYSYFDIGHNHYYEDDETNRTILQKVANKCYLPTNTLLHELITQHHGRFKIALSITGTVIEQFKRFSPKTLDSFKALVDTGHVELISETYYHSLSFIYSKQEFVDQVMLHRELMEREFGYKPVTFRNTELIYNNQLAQLVESLGYSTILAEGADRVLGWRSPNYIYRPIGCQRLLLLLKNYRLSDDIAFRFSNRAWKEYPLHAEKFAHWVHAYAGSADVINLFMDYETFGEHQWEDTGIFDFLRVLPEQLLKHPDFNFCTPNEARQWYQPIAELDVPDYVSWADNERDLSAWCGNPLQDDALTAVYALEHKVKALDSEELIRTWRSLLTSDHFYYLCTKHFHDGDVHKYFNPYQSPYEAYITYMNVISDFSQTIEVQQQASQNVVELEGLSNACL